MDWSTFTNEPLSCSASANKRKRITSSSFLPLIPCLTTADQHASQGSKSSQRLPTTALKPKYFMHSERQQYFTFSEPKGERTFAVFTPKYSSLPRISPREVSNKRDFSASIVDQNESKCSKKSRNCYKMEYLGVGTDGVSCPYLPTSHLGKEISKQTFQLRPRKTHDTRISSLFSSWTNK